MNKRRCEVFAIALILLLAGSLPVFSSADKAWYVAPLEKLGFYVFEKPFVFEDFQVSDLSGAVKSRASVKGKVVLLNFWATWCPPCKAEIPGIEALSRSMKGKSFEVFAVNLGDDPKTVKSFVADNKISFPVYLDPRNLLSRTYASQGIPTTYLLDKQGRFIAGIVGGYDYTKPELKVLLEELAAR
jgi:thiol-disulfide isomerase/thioredoxin